MKRIQWPLPQPQPTTPIKGQVVPLTFKDYVAARTGGAKVHPAVKRLYRTHGAYKCKPKRVSVGVVWNNMAFWWSTKGFYRMGKAVGPRRPLQHLIWEAHYGRTMPAGSEIFFKDRDRHNFSIRNMELLSKAQMHQRIFDIGETRSLSFEERSVIRGRWAVKHSRTLTGLLFRNFQHKGSHDHHDKTKFLIKRREKFNHGPRKI
jgi:hypothetical protein